MHVKAPPGDRHDRVQFTAIGTSDTEVVPMGDDVLIINGGGDRPVRVPMWPVAAIAIAAIIVGGALWLFGRDGRKPSPTPVVIHQGGGSTMDPVARANADAALAEARTKASREEVTQGLAENTTHDRGYGRVYTNGVVVPLAKEVREVRYSMDEFRQLVANGRLGEWPSICARDPDLPTCRKYRQQ